MSPTRIDTHFHIVSSRFTQAIAAAGGDPAGWHVPEWTPASAIEAMDTLGTQKAVLSNTAPGPAIAGNGDAGRKLARELNEETLQIVKENPTRFGWFACLPDWTDAEGALTEIEWALTTAKADGVVILTSYHNLLLGHASFQQIWDKLDSLKATVFIHPTSFDIVPKFIGGNLPQPVVDYPVATTRTAVDLILTKTMAKHPNVKLILSHGGGTLPFLSERILGITPDLYGLSTDQVQHDMKRFWIDVALTTSKGQLEAILAFTTPDKIVYGSDFPYVTLQQAKIFTDRLDKFIASDPRGKELEGVNENAKALFSWERKSSA